MFQRRDFDLTPINIKQIWIWCNLARVGAIAHCIETSAGSHMMMEDRASVRGSNNMGVDVWAPRWWQVLSKYYATLPQYLDTMTQYCRPVARVWVLSKSTHCVGAQLGLAATPPPSPLAIDFKGVIWSNAVCNSQYASNDVQRCAVFLIWKYGIYSINGICTKNIAVCPQFVNELRIAILYHLPPLYWSFLLEVSNFEWFIWYFGSCVYYKFGNTVLGWYLDRRKCFNSTMQHNTGVFWYSTKLMGVL